MFLDFLKQAYTKLGIGLNQEPLFEDIIVISEIEATKAIMKLKDEKRLPDVCAEWKHNLFYSVFTPEESRN